MKIYVCLATDHYHTTMSRYLQIDRIRRQRQRIAFGDWWYVAAWREFVPRQSSAAIVDLHRRPEHVPGTACARGVGSVRRKGRLFTPDQAGMGTPCAREVPLPLPGRARQFADGADENGIPRHARRLQRRDISGGNHPRLPPGTRVPGLNMHVAFRHAATASDGPPRRTTAFARSTCVWLSATAAKTSREGGRRFASIRVIRGFLSCCDGPYSRALKDRIRGGAMDLITPVRFGGDLDGGVGRVQEPVADTRCE